MVIIALIAPWISPYDPIAQDMNIQHGPPSWAHPFGTDSYGRDQLSRILWGSRVSLVVGILSVFCYGSGIPLGMIGGYKGGRIDNLVNPIHRHVHVVPHCDPGASRFGHHGSRSDQDCHCHRVGHHSPYRTFGRGSTLSLKGKEYIEAARAIGQNHIKIMFIHILPNILGDILVMGTLWVATAIIVEASLSFIGLGIRPPTPSWGAMIRDGLDQLTNAPWLSFFPGLAIFLSVFSFNLIADGLRDISDPKLRG